MTTTSIALQQTASRVQQFYRLTIATGRKTNSDCPVCFIAALLNLRSQVGVELVDLSKQPAISKHCVGLVSGTFQAAA